MAASPKLEVPSLFLIGAGALGVLAQLYGLINTLGGAGEIPPEVWQQIPSEHRALAENIVEMMGVIGPLVSLVLMSISAFVVFGGLQMRQGKSWGLAVAASVVAMFQCSLACCVGLPVGIWCLVLLMNDDVKASFS